MNRWTAAVHREEGNRCYPIAPLRNASACLIFDRTLFWLNGAWVIHTPIQKTHLWNPKAFVMALEPQHGQFIDALILGDADERHLAELREEVLAKQRLLFVLPDGKPTAETYVPRIYKTLTGNSFTTTRTTIQTECMTAHGLAGRNMAMAVCHQTSTRIAEKHEADVVAFAAIARRQANVSERQHITAWRLSSGNCEIGKSVVARWDADRDQPTILNACERWRRPGNPTNSAARISRGAGTGPSQQRAWLRRDGRKADT